MDKYIIFDLGGWAANFAAFNVLNSKISTALGYPNNQGTSTYANPIIHPNGERIAINIMSEVEHLLSESERNSLVNDLTDDWNQ